MKPRPAHGLVDDSYRQFVHDTCRRCGRRFRPPTPSHHYCGGRCAYEALFTRRKETDHGFARSCARDLHSRIA
jgi:hypothetical protein